MKIICSSGASFNPAARDFASRVLVFSTIGSEEVAAVEELTCRHGRRRTFGRDGQEWSMSAYNGPSSTLILNNPFRGRAAVGRSTFMFSFIQRQHFEPNQPTSECLQVARQRCLDRAHNGQLTIGAYADRSYKEMHPN
jgi:hypothetical protein